eukprot:scpid60120/ scgid13003/ 
MPQEGRRKRLVLAHTGQLPGCVFPAPSSTDRQQLTGLQCCYKRRSHCSSQAFESLPQLHVSGNSRWITPNVHSNLSHQFTCHSSQQTNNSSTSVHRVKNLHNRKTDDNLARQFFQTRNAGELLVFY